MEPTKEQDVLDFAKVVIKRRRLIFGIVAVIVTAGAVFAFLSPKVFVVDTLIEVGTYPGFEGALVPLENPHQLTEKIASGSYDAAIKAKLGLPEQKALGLKATSPDNTNLVRVYINSSRPEDALPVLREVGELVIADHAARG